MLRLWWKGLKENISMQKGFDRLTFVKQQIKISSLTIIINITIKYEAIQLRFKFDRVFSSFYYQFYLLLCDKHSKQSIQKSNRASIMPAIQLIQAQILMKKMSTKNFDKEPKIKMSISTHSLFNKLQQKMTTSMKKDQLKSVKEIENKNKKELVSKIIKNTPNYNQFRIKTEASNYYFVSNNQKKSIDLLPNLSHIERNQKNNLTLFESKTPRLLLARSEKYNQKQPLTQRLMCTYLKKQITNHKLSKSNNKS